MNGIVERAVGDNEDAAVIERLRQGDPDAFTAVVARYGPMLHRLARRHVRSAAAAEDVVQDTWLAALEGIGQFEGRSSLRTWLCTIVTYQAQRQAGRARRVMPFSDAFATGRDEPVAAVLDVVLSRELGHDTAEPLAELLAGEVRTTIGGLIAGLPPRQRVVVMMVDVQGRPADEVGALLGISQGNLRILLHRARLRLRGGARDYLA